MHCTSSAVSVPALPLTAGIHTVFAWKWEHFLEAVLPAPAVCLRCSWLSCSHVHAACTLCIHVLSRHVSCALGVHLLLLLNAPLPGLQCPRTPTASFVTARTVKGEEEEEEEQRDQRSACPTHCVCAIHLIGSMLFTDTPASGTLLAAVLSVQHTIHSLCYCSW